MSENLDTELLRDLTQFGLNRKEALVYISLLLLGNTGTSRIEKHSGLHRQFVYDALASLREKGLAHYYQDKNKKRWVAEPPRTFLGLADEKTRIATRLSDQLATIIPIAMRQEISVIEGATAFQERELDLIKKVKEGSALLMLCGMWEKYYEAITLPKYETYERIRRERNIGIRFIGPHGTKLQLSAAKATRSNTEYRYLDGLERSIMNTIIYEESVDFAIFGNPIVLFSMKNKDVAESQRGFFESLWKMGSL